MDYFNSSSGLQIIVMVQDINGATKCSLSSSCLLHTYTTWQVWQVRMSSGGTDKLTQPLNGWRRNGS